MTWDRLLGLSKLRKLLTWRGWLDVLLHAGQGALVVGVLVLLGGEATPLGGAAAAAVAGFWRELSQWRRTRSKAKALAKMALLAIDRLLVREGPLGVHRLDVPRGVPSPTPQDFHRWEDWNHLRLKYLARARYGSPHILDRVVDVAGFALGGSLVGGLV